MNDRQENQDTSKVARFFKCALQVNPAGYIKYRGQQQSLLEEEYNQQLLNATLETGIEVVGLADHGSVDSVDSIRNLFTQNGIVVFPGFEIASSEKIHFVCLFDETKTSKELERILGSLQLLDPKDGARPSRLSAEQLIEEVKRQKGFIYAAHCTSENGLLKHRKMEHIWKNADLLAAQIPGSIEDLSGIESDFYRKVFLNKESPYFRKREMVAINAKDIANPEDIKSPTASCLIKMTKPCFTSFKQAFLDAGSRVRLNSDKPENYGSAIESLSFIGGYLDGVNITLSDHLNVVIGGRGTGKSTLVECIRFVFDLKPFGQTAQKQHDAIIKNNIGHEKGLVKVVVRSARMHGRKFIITRKYGSDPIVTDDAGNISPYRPKDLLPSLELFGQNEIYEMTREENSRNQLIERFLKGDHEKFEADKTQILKKLKDNQDKIERAIEQRNELEIEIESLPKLEDQAKQFQTLGIDEKLKIIPKLEREKQLITRVNEELSRIQEAIKTLRDSLPDTTFLSAVNLNGLPHADLLAKQGDTLDNVKIKLTAVVEELEQLTATSSESLIPIQNQLTERHSFEETQLDNTFKLIPTNQGKTGRQIGSEYQTLLKQIEQIRPKKNSLNNQQKLIDELYNQRTSFLRELDMQTSSRASFVQRSVKRLNNQLDQKVQLKLESEGHRQALIDFLTDCNLEGIGPKRLQWILEKDFSPAKLAATIREGEKSVIRAFSITDTVAKQLCRLPESKLLALEEIVIPDTVSIELNVKHDASDKDFRPLSDLSTGQQCTAILHLLLLDNQDPLILDQPEDNLDNAFIADRIVAELRKAKLNRQFLFATHNANIPVFGDAEWIGVFSVRDNKGQILPEQQGAIDIPAVQKLAVDILEGGKNAFNQRREKYDF